MGRNSGVSRQTTGVAGLQARKAAAEPWAIVFGPGQLVREGQLLGDSLLSEGVELQAEILVVRADAGVPPFLPRLLQLVQQR